MTHIAYSGSFWTQFRVSRDLFTDLTAGMATVRTFKASVTTRRAPLCGGSASDSVAETQRTVPPTHVASACFERRRSTQRARSGYWTVCNNCCVRCVSCGNVADTCVQRTAVHLRRPLPVRFGRLANANLMPVGTSTAVPPTCVPGATDVRVTQRTQPPHTCSAAYVRVTHLAGTLEARRACFRWG